MRPKRRCTNWPISTFWSRINQNKAGGPGPVWRNAIHPGKDQPCPPSGGVITGFPAMLLLIKAERVFQEWLKRVCKQKRGRFAAATARGQTRADLRSSETQQGSAASWGWYVDALWLLPYQPEYTQTHTHVSKVNYDDLKLQNHKLYEHRSNRKSLAKGSVHIINDAFKNFKIRAWEAPTFAASQSNLWGASETHFTCNES